MLPVEMVSVSTYCWQLRVSSIKKEICVLKLGSDLKENTHYLHDVTRRFEDYFQNNSDDFNEATEMTNAVGLVPEQYVAI